MQQRCLLLKSVSRAFFSDSPRGWRSCSQRAAQSRSRKGSRQRLSKQLSLPGKNSPKNCWLSCSSLRFVPAMLIRLQWTVIRSPRLLSIPRLRLLPRWGLVVLFSIRREGLQVSKMRQRMIVHGLSLQVPNHCNGSHSKRTSTRSISVSIAHWSYPMNSDNRSSLTWLMKLAPMQPKKLSPRA